MDLKKIICNNIGNDCLDLSFSKGKLQSLEAKEIGDKAISLGESSFLNINNAKIYCDRKKLGVHSVWSNFMPLFHTAGCATGTLGCLSAACKMLLIKRFDAKIFAKLIL